MGTSDKANIAVLKFMLRAAEKGKIILAPTTEGLRFDYVVYDGESFKRVQVKYSGCESSKSDGAIQVNLRKRNGQRFEKKAYDADEVDALVVYIPQIDKVVWLDQNEFVGKPAINIRFKPTKNGQKQGCIFAEERLW